MSKKINSTHSEKMFTCAKFYGKQKLPFESNRITCDSHVKLLELHVICLCETYDIM